MKKILFLCDFFSCLGGTEYYNYVLICNLIQKKYEISVYVGEKPSNNFWVNKLNQLGVNCKYPDKQCSDLVDRKIEIEFLSFYKKEIQDWEPDIIYVNPAGKMIVTWFEVDYPKKIPVIATEWTTPSINTEHWYPKELKSCINKISAYIVTCHKSLCGLREYFNYQGDIFEIPHIIPYVNKWEEKCNVKEIVNSVGCISRLSTEKGIPYLLGAWKYLYDMNNNASLHIYGEGNEKKHLIELIDALGIKQSVILEGTFEPFCGIDQVCQKHMIFVQPSLFESIPTSIIELMSKKRFIISTNVGGVSEIINYQFDDGLLIKPASTDQIVSAVKFAWDNPNRIVDMALRARCVYEDKYDINKNINRIINVMKKYSK